MIYRWQSGARISGARDPQVVGERLEGLRKQFGGRLTAEIVLAEAQSLTSVLHPAFEWNDGRAAQEYRLVQARELIRAVVVLSEESQREPVRAFVVVGVGPEHSYTSTRVAMADPVLRAQVLGRAKKELAEWRKRYADLQEFARLFAVIDESRVA